jgi:flagellar basal body rod protein FlgG
MKPPTDDEIREEVYRGTMQETGREVDMYINGMIYMRNMWQKSLDGNLTIDETKWVYERDGDKIYRRNFGAPHETRELING